MAIKNGKDIPETQKSNVIEKLDRIRGKNVNKPGFTDFVRETKPHFEEIEKHREQIRQSADKNNIHVEDTDI